MLYETKKLLKHIVISIALLSSYAGSMVTAQAASFSNIISDKELDQDRGTYAPAISNEAISDISGTVNGGTDINTVSGFNMISSGALDGVGGLATIIQNSGNDVGIQAATTVNVTFVNTVGR